jgi:hypothetical protein
MKPKWVNILIPEALWNLIADYRRQHGSKQCAQLIRSKLAALTLQDNLPKIGSRERGGDRLYSIGIDIEVFDRVERYAKSRGITKTELLKACLVKLFEWDGAEVPATGHAIHIRLPPGCLPKVQEYARHYRFDAATMIQAGLARILDPRLPISPAPPRLGMQTLHCHHIPIDVYTAIQAGAAARGTTTTALVRSYLCTLAGVTATPKTPPNNRPRTPAAGVFANARARAKTDAPNRLPILITFACPHHYIQTGLINRLRHNGFTRRGECQWVGWLRPDYIDGMVADLDQQDGVLQVIGKLGDPLPPPVV